MDGPVGDPVAHAGRAAGTQPAAGDGRRAWTGPLSGEKEAEFRVEAASYLGRPVVFRVVGPWEKPAESAADPQTKGERVGQIFASILFVAILLGALLLARRNIRLGRSDRNGAFRIASFFIAVHMLGWVLWGTYLADVNAMVGAFIGTLAATLFEGVMVYVLYLALEPFLRKRWPETIISWTRALAGRFRDPLVGRDILLGCLLGVATEALSDVPRWLGLDPRRPDSFPLSSLPWVVAIAGYGFHTSFAGRPLFGESLLQE